MVTGYNVDVRHEGKVYHVQTEDRGRKNPIIETLIYLGGLIIHQEKISYADQNDDKTYDERRVFTLLDRQHKRLIEVIQTGAFDPDRKPYGEEFLTSRTLDECILAYLEEEASKPSLALSLVSSSPLTPGARGVVMVRAHRGDIDQAMPGVVIRPRVIRSDGPPTILTELSSDERGEARIEFDVPNQEDLSAALVIQADSDLGRAELEKQLR